MIADVTCLIFLFSRSILPRTGGTYEGSSESRSFDSISTVKGSRPRSAGSNMSMGNIDVPSSRGRSWASMDERDMAALGLMVESNRSDMNLIDSCGTPSTSSTSVSGEKDKFLMTNCYIGFLTELYFL